MEKPPGGATRFRRRHPSAERYLGTLQPPKPSAASPSLELSEDDIFSTLMECLPASPARPIPNPCPKPAPKIGLNHYGILSALNRSGSGSATRPVFNLRASPATSEVSIPRPTPIQGEMTRFFPRSAPVNIPVIPAALRRRVEEEEDTNRVVLPAAPPRDSYLLAWSVVDSASRTVKGRDLRQVRNAIFRKTGFLD